MIRSKTSCALFTGLAGLVASTSLAETYQWSAVSDGSWFAPANWNPAGIPSAAADTAAIGGDQPLSVFITDTNAMVGAFHLLNPAARVQISHGQMLSLANSMTLDGVIQVGNDAVPPSPNMLRLSTVGSTVVNGSGRVVLRGPKSDPSWAQISASPFRPAQWNSGTTIEGTGAIYGTHRVLGTVLANGSPPGPNTPAGGALELRSALIDGFGSGKCIADGVVLRIYQSKISDAFVQSQNGGTIELWASAPGGSATLEMLARCTVRGNVRSHSSTTNITSCDFDANLEILPSSRVTFTDATKPLHMSAIVHSGTGSGGSALTFPQGTPQGSGEIVLDADNQPEDALLVVNQMLLGGNWKLRGQGLVDGTIQLDGTIVADRPAGPPLAFSGGNVLGPGVIHAQGGVADFRERCLLQDVQLIASEGGSFRVSRSQQNIPTRWVNVQSQSLAFTQTGGEFTIQNSSLAGTMRLESGSLTIAEGVSTISGEILLTNSGLFRAGQLRLPLGSTLLGAGEITMRSLSQDSMPVLNFVSQTLSAERPIRGSGKLYGYFTFLGRITADGPDGRPLDFMPGTYSGANQGVIEIQSGGQLRMFASSSSDRVTIRDTKITAQEGALPIVLGDAAASNSGQCIFLTSVDVDAECIAGQYGVTFRDSRFRRRVIVDHASSVYVYSSRFDDEMVIRYRPGEIAPAVNIQDAATSISRIRFENALPGVPGANFSPSSGSALRSEVRGTGNVSSAVQVGGLLAPSDESSGSPQPGGLLRFSNLAITMLPEASLEIDIKSLSQYDRIDVPIGAAVNGALRVTMDEDCYPPPSFNFYVVKGAVTGAFATVVGPPGYRISMTYNRAGALARLEKICGSDLNGDLIVDDADFAIFCAGYDLFSCADPAMPLICPADLDRDGYVDDVDFRVFVRAYAQFACPED